MPPPLPPAPTVIDWMVFACLLLLFTCAFFACLLGCFAAVFAGPERRREKPSYLRLEHSAEDGAPSPTAEGHPPQLGRMGSAQSLAREYALLPPSPLGQSTAPRHPVAPSPVARSQFAPSPVNLEAASSSDAARPSLVPPLLIPPREADPEKESEWEIERLRGRIANGYLLTTMEIALLEAVDAAGEKQPAPRQPPRNSRGVDSGGHASSSTRTPEATRSGAHAKRPSSPRMAALSRRTGTASQRSPAPPSSAGPSAGRPASHRVARGAGGASAWQA